MPRIVLTHIGKVKKITARARGLSGLLTIEINKGMRAEADEQVKLFKLGTATWNEHHPEFVPKYQRQGDLFMMSISVDTDTEDGRIYQFVNKGTEVRHALMTDPFEAKTEVGKLTSRAGVGHMVAVSKKKFNFDGLEPRAFNKQVYALRRKIYAAKFQETIKRVHAYFVK